MLPGIIGTLQAAEAIKWLAGMGTSALGRLWHIDVSTLRSRDIQLRRDPQCELCGDSPTQTALLDDYEAFAPPPPCSIALPPVPEISQAEFRTLRRGHQAYVLLDVRDPDEVAERRIAESVCIPLGDLEDRLPDVLAALSQAPTGAPFVVHCHSGKRSARALVILQSHGITHGRNLVGGIAAFVDEPGAIPSPAAE